MNAPFPNRRSRSAALCVRTGREEMLLRPGNMIEAQDFPYIYRWPQFPSRSGQHCRIVVCGTMYTCLVEFADGFRMITSVNLLRDGIPKLSSVQSGRNPDA